MKFDIRIWTKAHLRHLFFSFFELSVFLLKNYKKLKKSKQIFVNTWGFGHSITDSLTFLSAYENSLVISIGHAHNRDRTAERTLAEKKILPLQYSNCEEKCKNHIVSLLNRLLRIFLSIGSPKLPTIFFDNRVLMNSIVEKTWLRLDSSSQILASSDSSFANLENAYDEVSSPHFIGHTAALALPSQSLFPDSKKNANSACSRMSSQIVLLNVRKGNSPHHSVSDYYFPVINYLIKSNFSVLITGDSRYILENPRFQEIGQKDSILNLSTDADTNKEVQLKFIQDSLFAVGDQGGTWSLFHAFHKRGLLINSIPISHLQFGVMTLPRVWFDASGSEIENSRDIFGDLFHRNKSKQVDKGASIFPIKGNTLMDILLSLEDYIESNLFLREPKIDPRVLKVTSHKNFFRFAQHSGYSDIYLRRLKW